MSSTSSYQARLTDPLITELTSELPALLLVGPRATGKTTTAKRIANTVLQLDRPAVAGAVQADPDAALRDLRERCCSTSGRPFPTSSAR